LAFYIDTSTVVFSTMAARMRGATARLGGLLRHSTNFSGGTAIRSRYVCDFARAAVVVERRFRHEGTLACRNETKSSFSALSAALAAGVGAAVAYAYARINHSVAVVTCAPSKGNKDNAVVTTDKLSVSKLVSRQIFRCWTSTLKFCSYKNSICVLPTLNTLAGIWKG
jgi:hypothetical protein